MELHLVDRLVNDLKGKILLSCRQQYINLKQDFYFYNLLS